MGVKHTIVFTLNMNCLFLPSMKKLNSPRIICHWKAGILKLLKRYPVQTVFAHRNFYVWLIVLNPFIPALPHGADRKKQWYKR
jgi:hypothetical protein